jgi:xanthine dehydrogenase molybdopterin-binding subunit B
MAQDIYRDDLAVKERDPYIGEPRSAASYIRDPSSRVGMSPFILAVAIAAAIALASVALVGMPKQSSKLANAPATTEQPVAPATH